MTVVILEDAAEDLEAGAQFYESCAIGVGDYFLDSILSDLDSLILFIGIHPIFFGFHRMLSKRFPFGIYYEWKTTWRTFMPFWICGAIRCGFGIVCGRER